MEKVKILKIQTEASQKSVKELRQELKALKDQLVSTEQGTEEYNAAVREAADIQHTLTETQEQIRASAMDTGQILGNVSKSFAGLSGAISSVIGVMSIFGLENETAEKTLKTLTSLIAVTQGLSAIDEGIKAVKRLGLVMKSSAVFTALFGKAVQTSSVQTKAAAAGNTVLSASMTGVAASTGAATAATQAFKTALISTGVGALVVAVGALIANLDKLREKFK